MTRLTANEEMAAIHAVFARKERVRPLLLQAFTEGRYAAQAKGRVHNPYRGQMAEAWEKGWVSVDGEP